MNPARPPLNLTQQVSQVVAQHLGLCQELLALAQRESEALQGPSPYPAAAFQAERKALLSRLECGLKLLVETRSVWQQASRAGAQDPRLGGLLQAALDTIMRVLVLDRENEQHLLRRGRLPARALPPAEQSQPHYVARLYQRHLRA